MLNSLILLKEQTLAEITAFIADNGKALGADAEKIGLRFVSSNPSAVLPFLASPDSVDAWRIKCSAFFCPELKLSAAYSFSAMNHVPYFIAVGL
jgi:hypothetical protein